MDSAGVKPRRCCGIRSAIPSDIAREDDLSPPPCREFALGADYRNTDIIAQAPIVAPRADWCESPEFHPNYS